MFKGGPVFLHFFLSTLFLGGEALPRRAAENSSFVNASTTERNASCGLVTTNVIIQGVGIGVAGPQGERGPAGPAGPAGPTGPASTAVSSGGVSFTRWGRTVCPNSEGTELLYDGIVTGSGGREGGSAEYICLHRQPQFLRTASGFQERRSRIYGAELRAVDNAPAFSSIVRHNHPCAVCYTPTRNTKITIPGRTSCPPSWTREYYGYLMADYHHSIHKGKVPICVDRNSESVHGSAGFSGGSPLYFIETSCNGIPCPPYFSGAEITCTVCTK